MRAADHVVDIGPGRRRARRATSSRRARPPRSSASPSRLTGQYLAGTRRIEVPARRRTADRQRRRSRARRSTTSRTSTCEIPLGDVRCVTGVSGSGKSSLGQRHPLQGASRTGCTGRKQRPGAHRADRPGSTSSTRSSTSTSRRSAARRARTRRRTSAVRRRSATSSPRRRRRRRAATSRAASASTSRAAAARRARATADQDRDALPARRLRAVRGCDGKRYNRETLEVRYKGKNIADVLEMAVEEALELLRERPEDPPRAPDAARRRARLHQARPAGDDALRRRGAAHQARRASWRKSRPGARSTSSTSRRPGCTSTTSSSCWRCCTAGRPGQHRRRDRAQPRRDQDGRLASIDLGPEGGDEGGGVIATGTPEEIVATPARSPASSCASCLGAPRRARAQSAQGRGRGLTALSRRASSTRTRRAGRVRPRTRRFLRTRRRAGAQRGRGERRDPADRGARVVAAGGRGRRTCAIRGGSERASWTSDLLAWVTRYAHCEPRRGEVVAGDSVAQARCGRRSGAGTSATRCRGTAPDPLGAHAARGVRALAAARQRARGAREGRLEVGAHALFEPGVWLTAPAPGAIRIGDGTFLNRGVMVAAVELVEIGAHCMLANGCFVTDGNHRFDDPDKPVPWQGFTTKGPTRIGDNVLARRQRRRHERRDDRRALRDRRQQRRHARHPAVLDRRRCARRACCARSTTTRGAEPCPSASSSSCSPPRSSWWCSTPR